MLVAKLPCIYLTSNILAALYLRSIVRATYFSYFFAIAFRVSLYILLLIHDRSICTSVITLEYLFVVIQVIIAITLSIFILESYTQLSVMDTIDKILSLRHARNVLTDFRILSQDLVSRYPHLSISSPYNFEFLATISLTNFLMMFIQEGCVFCASNI